MQEMEENKPEDGQHEQMLNVSFIIIFLSFSTSSSNLIYKVATLQTETGLDLSKSTFVSKKVSVAQSPPPL